MMLTPTMLAVYLATLGQVMPLPILPGILQPPVGVIVMAKPVPSGWIGIRPWIDPSDHESGVV